MVITMMDRFFPVMNAIWSDSYHYAHVSVLETTRIACEYGFIKADDCPRLIKVLVKATQSLTKLIDAWNEKGGREEDEFKEEQRSMKVKAMDEQEDIKSRMTETPYPVKKQRDVKLVGESILAIMVQKDTEENDNLFEEVEKKLTKKQKMKAADKDLDKAWMSSDKKRKLYSKYQMVADFFA